ncbi:MAG: CHAD domain-containing protein [Gammaproteobacteria bacterium]|nr:CHAD domain-containing protein [Gammaproteobacteria bacterium]
MSYLIKQDEPAGAGIQRVLQEQSACILALLSEWQADPAASIHRARQACKRARAVAQLLKVAAPYAATVENGFFRGVQKRVAYARDNEALVEALDFLKVGVTEPRLAESVAMLRDSLSARAAHNLLENRSSLCAQIDIACHDLRSAERRLSRLPIEDLRRRDLRRGATKTWERCVAGFSRLEPDSPPAGYHDWRRQVKYAYHQTQLLAAICPMSIEAPLRELSATLGHCQDLEILENLMRQQPDALRIDTHVQRLRQLIGTSLQNLRRQSLDLGRNLFQPGNEALVTERKQSGKRPATGDVNHSPSSTRRAIPDRDPHSSRRWQFR